MRTIKAGRDVNKCLCCKAMVMNVGRNTLCDGCKHHLQILRRALQEGTEPDPIWLRVLTDNIYTPIWYKDKTTMLCVKCNTMRPYMHKSKYCVKCK